MGFVQLIWVRRVVKGCDAGLPTLGPQASVLSVYDILLPSAAAAAPWQGRPAAERRCDAGLSTLGPQASVLSVYDIPLSSAAAPYASVPSIFAHITSLSYLNDSFTLLKLV